MSSLSRELVLLILQFLEEEKFKDAAHKLEQESAFFFNVKHFEEKAMAGEWDEVESYLSGFTKVDDNRYSMKIFFEIRKQKYLEALDRQDKGKALEILTKDLKAFATFNEELYKEITQLLTLNNFRENEQLSKYGDTKTARTMMLIELRKLIEANPLFRDKLVFPTLKQSRLRTLINQSLNWQHQLCKHPRSNPDIKTLFVDHSCSPSNGVRTPTPVTLPVTAVARPPTYAPIPVHAAFPPMPAASSANVLAGWMANATASSSVQSLAVATPVLSVQPNQVPVLKRARTPPNPLGMVEIDYQSSEREHLMKRARQTDEVSYPAALQQASSSMDQLPKTVACTLYQGSDVTSIDFHPSCQTSVIVGCGNGEVTLWDIGLCEKLVSKPFRIWDKSRSLPFQAAFVKDPSLSTRRVRWSPDGNMIGVAFTKQLIQLYATEGRNDLCQCVEIDAHVGGVNDLAFSYPNKQLCVVTCGDDKLIKVWDLTGRKLFNFEGHEEPVYSICPHHKENIQFIFSTAIDGKIKAWLYDNLGSRVDYDAPGHGRTTMLYSADGTRLFSCGTGKDGDSFLVEWNESEGAIKRSYSGFRKKSAGVVQFDTTQNRFLAAGEDHQIKFWDMDNANILTSTDAEGGLPSVPCLRFNKEGNLLAVSTADKGFKILASTEALRSLRAFESRTFEGSRVPIEPSGTKVSGLAPAQAPAQAPAPAPAPAASNSAIVPRGDTLQRSSPSRPSPVLNGDDLTARSVEKERASGDVPDNAKVGDLAEIVDPVKCQVVTAPDSADPLSKVVRLLYTNSGNGVLALGSEGVQKLWKWPRSEQNPSGKATATVVPQHWQPNSGLAMKNDVSGVNIEEAVPCIALSKNDSYVMSATGGTVSLFNMMTFKVMTQFMRPPPTPTFLAFHPDDNNIIAVGTKDSTVHIYNVRIDEVKSKLRGHQKQITGLAFSTKLNILVSSGADARVCFWNTDTWEMRKSVTVQAPDGKEAVGGTRVQFNYDQIRLLVSNETQIAVYDASKMEFVKQWAPQGVLSAPMTCAVYSQRSKLVYASFLDGNIGVFDADTLKLKCRIAPSAYLPQAMVCSVHPLVIAAHPHDPNQFAVGMSDGSVKVLQPLECDGKWGGTAPLENRVRIVRTVLAPVANEVQIGTTTPAENGAEAERSTPGRTVLESAENGAQSGKATAEEVAESSSTSNNHAPEQTK